MQANTIPIYQIDAFSDQCFKGNPAAICVLEKWLSDDLMQNIAFENNLSETAFIVYKKGIFHIRYFTPSVEVDLCGHATLAASFVAFRAADDETQDITFRTLKRGDLHVRREGEKLIMTFPKDIPHRTESNAMLEKGLGAKPKALFKGATDYLALFKNQEEIDNLEPDFKILRTLKMRGIIVTAQGKDVDFVSRFFAPPSGIDEDPVTGSAHTTLTPFWAERLGKSVLKAEQRSKRGGFIECENLDKHVKMTGTAVLYMQGEIYI